MIRRSTSVFCSLALLIGILLGGWLDSLPFAAPVRANALDSRAAEELYRELGSRTSPLVDGGHVLAKISALTSPSVVHIQSEHEHSRGRLVEETGSGVIVESSKAPGLYVVTNRHVIADADPDAVAIHLDDGRVITPEQIWSDPASDVAVMKVVAPHLRPARWGNSDDVQIGHMVLAMGSPFGLSQSVTMGIISAKGRRSLRLGGGKAGLLNQDFLQTDAAINPGNSGGPLIDMHGRIIGLNTAIASNGGGNEGIGFSIPSNLVRRVVEQLLEHGRVERAYLGVRLDSDFDGETAARLQLDRARGAHVLDVYPNTPASRANLKYDDVVLSFDGIDVQDENHLINLVSLTPVGKRVRLVVFRNGAKLSMTVVLEDRELLEQRSQPARTAPGTGFRIEPMGLSLRGVDSSIAGQLGFEATARGLLVLKVDPSSSLGSQLELYDLIEEVARVPVTSVESLQRVLKQYQSAETVLLQVRRVIDGRPERLVIAWQPQARP